MRNGRITVPVEIRRALGLKERDRVALTLENDQVRLRRAESVVERTAGALRVSTPPLTAEELQEAAERAIAVDVVERTGTDEGE